MSDEMTPYDPEELCLPDYLDDTDETEELTLSDLYLDDESFTLELDDE